MRFHKLSPRSRLIATIALFCALPAAAEPVRLVLLSPPAQVAASGDLLSSPLLVRVERASGEPISGVQLSFTANAIVCQDPPLPGVPCPTSEWYGDFEGAPPATPNTIVVTSDADGVATTPLFRVGTPPSEWLPFGFEMFPYASAQTTANGFTITLDDAVHPIGGLLAAATDVVIMGGGAAAIPVLDRGGVVVLALLLAAASLWWLRRRS